MESGSEDSDLETAWNIGRAAVIPEKSKERYENTFKSFKCFCEKKNVK